MRVPSRASMCPGELSWIMSAADTIVRAMASVASRWVGTLRDSLRDASGVAPVRPSVWAGVRAAIATVLPLALAAFKHDPLLSWAGLAGFLASIVDKGGAYRTRAAAMGGLTLAGAVLCGLAALAGTRTDTALAATLVT